MITCWIYKRWISGCLDAGRDFPPKLGAHLRSCPNCRTFSDAAVRVSQRLRAEAGGEMIPPSPFLRGRILASLNRPPPAAVREIVRPAWSMAAGALALLLVGGLVIRYQHHRQSPPPAVSAPVGERSNPAGIVVEIARLPAQEKLREWSQKLDQPLQAELQSVFEDAQSAVALLAHNFLPDSFTPLR
ncbi:MAG: hypothetical protein HY735_04070 [Verrucomicrobia bacterium]|nr:hypothetical protein [Verrucomicrobiota bacterium]